MSQNDFPPPNLLDLARTWSTTYEKHQPYIILKSKGNLTIPRIRKIAFDQWRCSDIFATGLGYTPQAAYAAWLRNRTIGSPR